MRKRKWLWRGGFLLGLLVLLFVLFCWAFFNPLEGSVESLAALIPDDVTYMIHSPWGKLRTSELYTDRILGSNLLGSAEAVLDLETRLYRPVREAEEQINAAIPDFLGTFRALEDVAGREFLIAGHLTGPGDDLATRIGNSPYVLLTRISFRARFMEALKHGFVRDRIPDLKRYPFYYQYDIGADNVIPGSPESSRFLLFKRVRDVLILSNDRDLMEKVVRFGLAGGDTAGARDNLPGGNYWYYYDVREPSPEAALTVWFRVRQADTDLGFMLEGRREKVRSGGRDLLRAFFPVALTNTLTLATGTEGASTLTFAGGIRMLERNPLPASIRGFHGGAGEDLREAAGKRAALAPERGTFAFHYLDMAPRDFLQVLLTSAAADVGRMLFDEKDREWTPQRLAEDLGAWFEDGMAVLWARLPEMDGVVLDRYEGGDLEPRPGVTVIFRRKDRLSEDALLDYFRRDYDRYGFRAAPEEIPSAKGRLFKVDWPVDRKLSLIDPAFAFLDDAFLFSTNAGELKRVLETAAGERPSLGASDPFREALERSLPKGNLFLFVDGDDLCRFVEDQRWEVAFDEVYFDRQKAFNEYFARIQEEHRDWDRERVLKAAEEEMQRRLREQETSDFPAAIQRYRDRMFWWEALGWLTLSTGPAGDPAGGRLALRGALRLAPDRGGGR